MTSFAALRRLSPRPVAAAAALTALVALSACASDYDAPYRYAPYEAGAPAHVETGRIVDFRPIAFGPNEDNAAAGTVAGAVAGGVIGAASSRHDAGAFGVGGALLGALAGNAIARGGTHPGFAYIIRRRDGSTFEVAQPDPAPIPRGTRVYVTYGARVRVTPAPEGYAGDYPPPPPPPPPPPRY